MGKPWPKETVVEYQGTKLVAADDEILELIFEAAIFERVGSASVHESISVAIGCGRLIPHFLTERTR
jgi:hypothetical protein